MAMNCRQPISLDFADMSCNHCVDSIQISQTCFLDSLSRSGQRSFRSWRNSWQELNFMVHYSSFNLLNYNCRKHPIECSANEWLLMPICLILLQSLWLDLQCQEQQVFLELWVPHPPDTLVGAPVLVPPHLKLDKNLMVMEWIHKKI